jgi:hypothetical protein
MTNIYHGLLNKVRGSDATKDLKWWSIQYGSGMTKKWPEFEVSFSFEVSFPNDVHNWGRTASSMKDG